MNKKILALVFVLFVCFTFAGKVNRLDFSGSVDGNKFVSLGDGDAVRFDFRGMDNKIVIDRIDFEDQRVDLSIFIEGAEVPFYQAVNPQYAVQFDFDRDDVQDMKVSLYSVDLELESTILFFEGLNSFEAEVVEGEESYIGYFNYGFVRENYLYFILGLLILVFLLVERRGILRGYRFAKKQFR